LLGVGLEQLGRVVDVLVGSLGIRDGYEMLDGIQSVKIDLAVEARGFLKCGSAGVDGFAADAAGGCGKGRKGGADRPMRCRFVRCGARHRGSNR